MKRIHLIEAYTPSKYTLSKIYTRRTGDKAIILQSCFLDVSLRETNMVADKGLNLFDECAARYIHQSPQKEERVHLFLKGQ